MTTDEHVNEVRCRAEDLATALIAAQEAGVSPLTLIPAIMDVARETGLIPEGSGIPGLPF